MCSQHGRMEQREPPVQHPSTPEGKGKSGSRRRRLWELPAHSHCPVVGVCVPITTLRKLVNKSLRDQVIADDYEVHIGAVVECSNRNVLSESLQKHLEQRYAATIHRFAGAKTSEAVWELWVDAFGRGDVAGAFWAALTHARCDDGLENGLIRDMHMLQHQAGATVRTDLRKMEAIQEENRALAEELRKTQERGTKQMVGKVAELEQLNAELVQSRADGITKDSIIAASEKQLHALQAIIPELDTRLRQQQKQIEMAARQRDYEARIHELEQQLALARKQVDLLSAELAKAAHTLNIVAENTETAASLPVQLQDRTVLCVGGRTGNVRAYRQVVEKNGGQFAYHDGGIEDNHSLLEASLVAADMVICQTGCISHNAYWRVKDFCKRNGKRCVFVDNPSVSSLARSLEDVFAIEQTSA
jgi:hypothetical protein